MKPEFVCDMDEVLADFVDAACRVHNRPVDSVQSWLFYEQQWGITSDEFWSKIHNLGESFYGDWVKPKPWAFELFNRLTSLGPVLVTTSPGIGKPLDYSSKRIWIDKYFPGARLAVMSDKHWLAAPNRLLIDDNEDTCLKFVNSGGHACLVPYPWNCNRDLVSERLPAVGRQIDYFVRNLN